LLQTMF